MKAALLAIIFVLLTSYVVTAQDIKITSEESKDLNYFASTIRGIEEFNSEYIAVKIIEAGRTVGSYSDLPGLDVILYDFHISVKERTDDSPKIVIGNFWVDGDYHNPRNYKFDPATKTLTFYHGTDEKPKKAELILTAQGIKIK